MQREYEQVENMKITVFLNSEKMCVPKNSQQMDYFLKKSYHFDPVFFCTGYFQNIH